LANVPSQCRKVHADRENSCIARAVNDKRAVNDSFTIQDRRHLRSPQTNLRAAGRVGKRASKDANGRQHGICSHQGCDPSHHAWRKMSFEHTSQPTVRLIETTNGRRHLPNVFGFRGGAMEPRRRPASVVACALHRLACVPRATRAFAIYTIGLFARHPLAAAASIRPRRGVNRQGRAAASRARLVSQRGVE